MRTLLVALSASLLLGPAPGHAQIACGAAVGKGEKVVLTQDLGPCDGVAAAVTVDGGSLDLGGFTIACANLDPDGARPLGVVLAGKRSRVANGTIDGCLVGVVAGGTGRHRAKGVRATASQDDGFNVMPEAARTKLVGVVATANGEDGIHVLADFVGIVAATASGNAQDGIDLGSAAERNVLARAEVSDNGGAGILIDGARNRVTKPVATGNVVGVDLDGAQNVLRGGTLEGNLAYDVANCAGDTVKNVAFTTATPDCE